MIKSKNQPEHIENLHTTKKQTITNIQSSNIDIKSTTSFAQKKIDNREHIAIIDELVMELEGYKLSFDHHEQWTQEVAKFCKHIEHKARNFNIVIDKESKANTCVQHTLTQPNTRKKEIPTSGGSNKIYPEIELNKRIRKEDFLSQGNAATETMIIKDEDINTKNSD